MILKKVVKILLKDWHLYENETFSLVGISYNSNYIIIRGLLENYNNYWVFGRKNESLRSVCLKERKKFLKHKFSGVVKIEMIIWLI